MLEIELVTMELDGIDIITRSTVAPETLDAEYSSPTTETKTLPAGWRHSPEHAAFSADTIWEADVQITLRDGVKIRADIFRPQNVPEKSIPALIAWSPYGKSACRNGGNLVIHFTFLSSSYVAVMLKVVSRLQSTGHDRRPGGSAQKPSFWI